ncbi:MAG TPA: GntR family transcriptional regulator [Casimicrobiaceae bacterium]|nr:GntR family transcriptional regulator [Casimicrobiaceae bacterium]
MSNRSRGGGSRLRGELRAKAKPRGTGGSGSPTLASFAADTTVGESTYRRVRSDIVLGRLPPGGKLPLDRMRSAYGTSVSTLRELFSRLASEGLLVAEGSRGFHVPVVSSTNLREIAAMRRLLEGHAIEESFARGDLEWEAGVVAAHHMLASAEAKMAAGAPYPPETWRKYDWAFHRALIGACGSRLLLDTYASICDKFLRYQMIAAVFRGQAAADEHRVLLECALARDAPRAQATLATHIQDCVSQMACVLDAKPDWR